MMIEDLIKVAQSWIGRYFPPDDPATAEDESMRQAMCAAFCAHCLNAVGYAWPRGINTNWVPDYSGADNGRPLGQRIATRAELVPGDLVVFGGTYLDATSTHIGIHTGGQTMVHRPTYSRPVEQVRFDAGYWRDHFECGVRLIGGTAPGRTGPKRRRFKVFAHSGKLSILHDGKPVRATEIKLFANGGKLAVVVNGKTLEVDSLGLELVYREK